MSDNTKRAVSHDLLTREDTVWWIYEKWRCEACGCNMFDALMRCDVEAIENSRWCGNSQGRSRITCGRCAKK